jgi:hypothetical protein
LEEVVIHVVRLSPNVAAALAELHRGDRIDDAVYSFHGVAQRILVTLEKKGIDQ